MKLISVILFLLIASVVAAQSDLTVFSAASTTEAMKELAAAYEGGAGHTIRFNFASTGALARQINAGAPADLFISANIKWMDWLENNGRIVDKTRFNFAANELVMVAPKNSDIAFTNNIHGRIAVGDFKSVPAGMYAKEALTELHWLEPLRPKLIMASNVRTALMYVEHGEVSAGIVYATDAKASKRVSIIGTFPDESHSPIVYPAAACTEEEAVWKFITFLKSGTAKQILKRHGFK